MDEIYVIVWHGGYDVPSYAVRREQDHAWALAEEWANDMIDGIDMIDVLRVNLEDNTIERLFQGKG